MKKQKNVGFLLLGGSLPKGFTPDDVMHIMRMAKKRNIESIIDCPGSILSQVLKAKPFLIKPNLEEFHELTRTKVKSIRAVEREARKLLGQVPYICISSVEKGTLLVTREGSYFGRIPKVKIRSTVGAGDSMVGAMLSQFYQGQSSAEEILRWGLAAAAATLSETGTALGKTKTIHELYKKTRVKRIKI